MSEDCFHILFNTPEVRLRSWTKPILWDRKNLSNTHLCQQRKEETFLQQFARHVSSLGGLKSIFLSSKALPRSNLDHKWSPFYGTLKIYELFTFVPATEGSKFLQHFVRHVSNLQGLKTISIFFTALPRAKLDRERNPFYGTEQIWIIHVCASKGRK